jgi:hypothetical protein
VISGHQLGIVWVGLLFGGYWISISEMHSLVGLHPNKPPDIREILGAAVPVGSGHKVTVVGAPYPNFSGLKSH